MKLCKWWLCLDELLILKCGRSRSERTHLQHLVLDRLHTDPLAEVNSMSSTPLIHIQTFIAWATSTASLGRVRNNELGRSNTVESRGAVYSSGIYSSPRPWTQVCNSLTQPCFDQFLKSPRSLVWWPVRRIPYHFVGESVTQPLVYATALSFEASDTSLTMDLFQRYVQESGEQADPQVWVVSKRNAYRFKLFLDYMKALRKSCANLLDCVVGLLRLREFLTWWQIAILSRAETNWA